MKLRYTPLSVAITLVLSGTVHNTALAQTSPPQPAINACNNLSQGDNCSFQTPNGMINGSCGVIGNQLACMPANGEPQSPPNNGPSGTQPPSDGGTQPPPNNETGATQPPPNNGTSGTQPPNLGDTQSPPSGETPSEGSSQLPQPVIDGCIDLTEGSSCSFTTPDGTENGICTMMEDTLGCDPNGGGDISVTLPTEIGTLIGNTESTLPDSGQTYCYDDRAAITCPDAGEAFYGQDAQYQSSPMSYTDNGDGTITDNVTGIIWQQSPDIDGDGDIDATDKLSYTEAQNYCQNLTLANQTDWGLPDIKQLYSLIHFDGMDISGYNSTDTSELIPFIDTGYFDFGYGDTDAGERIIDAQYASNTRYVSTTMNGDETLFGVNFADGRIKGYGLTLGGQDKTFFVICARSNDNYGQNDFIDNGDGTITDNDTHLMWAQDDSGLGLSWEEALAWVTSMNAADYLGYNDWRLPNIKELQYLVDYTRSPETTDSAAIDPLFNVTAITNEGGQTDYPYFWSSTTHANFMGGTNAAYMSFGRAIGSMDSGNTWLDVHGAGAQRSDPKTGNAADYPQSHGPQGDAQRVFNYARLVRDATVTDTKDDENVYYEAENGLLHIPAVDTDALGLYQVTLRLIGIDTRYTPGFLFELTEATPVTSTPLASYDVQTGLLNLPQVTVGDMVYTNVKMTLVPDTETMRFAISALGE